MTNKEFRTSISNSAKNVLRKHSLSYNKIEVNSLYLSIGDVFFAQGDSRDELVDEAEKTSEKTGLNVKICLLWYLESAGAL